MLFVINPDTYQANVDKAQAQLKKNEAQAQKAARDLERVRPLYAQNAASRLGLDNAVAAPETAQAEVAMSRADLAQARLELELYYSALTHKRTHIRAQCRPGHFGRPGRKVVTCHNRQERHGAHRFQYDIA